MADNIYHPKKQHAADVLFKHRPQEILVHRLIFLYASVAKIRGHMLAIKIDTAGRNGLPHVNKTVRPV
jgi:hypothetical protein